MNEVCQSGKMNIGQGRRSRKDEDFVLSVVAPIFITTSVISLGDAGAVRKASPHQAMVPAMTDI